MPAQPLERVGQPARAGVRAAVVDEPARVAGRRDDYDVVFLNLADKLFKNVVDVSIFNV